MKPGPRPRSLFSIDPFPGAPSAEGTETACAVRPLRERPAPSDEDELEEGRSMEPHRTVRETEPAPEGTPARSASAGGWWAAALTGALLLAAGACAESTIGGSLLEKTGRITLSSEVPGATGSSSSRTGGLRADVTVDDEPQFVVDSVDAVIRQLQAGRQGAECASRPQGTSGDDDGGDCEEFGDGVAFVHSPPVSEGFDEIVTDAFIEPGTWNRLEFEFNVLESDPAQPEDQDILQQGRTDLRGGSVLIQGTFDGQEFELLIAVDGSVTLPAEPPLEIEDRGRGEMILVWNVSQWFDDGDGGVINPVDASADDSQGQALRDQIEANILESLEIRASTG